MELCFGYASPAFVEYIWAPPFAFEAILALLSVWAGIEHSRRVRFNKPLVDSLVHGNVIYFIR